MEGGGGKRPCTGLEAQIQLQVFDPGLQQVMLGLQELPGQDLHPAADSSQKTRIFTAAGARSSGSVIPLQTGGITKSFRVELRFQPIVPMVLFQERSSAMEQFGASCVPEPLLFITTSSRHVHEFHTRAYAKPMTAQAATASQPPSHMARRSTVSLTDEFCQLPPISSRQCMLQ